jgi:DNA-binding MarR family transcriptional regulator
MARRPSDKPTKPAGQRQSGGLRIDFLGDTIGYQIGRVRQEYMRLFTRHFDELSLTPAQFATLMAIEENPGTSQANLCAVLDTDPSRMVAIIDDLEARGLAARSASPTDRRTRVVTITPEGEKYLIRGREIAVMLDKLIVEGLEEREAEQFLSILKRICR